jgi:hypothetical protein
MTMVIPWGMRKESSLGSCSFPLGPKFYLGPHLLTSRVERDSLR